MPAETENLLAAEQAASELLSVLEDLRKETESYTTARHNLDSARTATVACADGLSELVASAKDVIEALSKIGTPEILERLSNVQQLQSDSQKETADLVVTVLGILESAERIDKLLPEIRSEQQDAKNELRDAQDLLEGKMEQLAQAQQDLSAANRNLLEKITASDSKAIARNRKQMMVLAFVVLLLFVVIALNIPAVTKLLGG